MLYDTQMSSATVITKEQAIALYESQSALARALGITKGAVSQWPDGKQIPENHALRLRYELKPEEFRHSAA